MGAEPKDERRRLWHAVENGLGHRNHIIILDSSSRKQDQRGWFVGGTK